MNDIEREIEVENQRISVLKKRKEELIYDIPEHISQQAKKSVKSFVFTTISLVFMTNLIGGSFLMDYTLLLLPTTIILGVTIGTSCIVDYFSKTKIARRKLKDWNIQDMDQSILKHENNIKHLNQELIFANSRVINEQTPRTICRYTPMKPQQVHYYQEDSYESERSR